MFIERPPFWFRLLFPEAIFRLPAPSGEKPALFLTFDDGPIPEVTPWVLEVLERYNIKATFFMVGQNIERYPDLLEEVRNRGHHAANHSLHHIKGHSCSAEEYLKDVEAGYKLTGSSLYRPPHGWLSPRQLKLVKENHYVVMFDVVTRDYSRHLTSRDVVKNIKKYTRNGSIIVFHDSLKSFPRLKEALPESIEWLLSRGYDFKLLEPHLT